MSTIENTETNREGPIFPASFTNIMRASEPGHVSKYLRDFEPAAPDTKDVGKAILSLEAMFHDGNWPDDSELGDLFAIMHNALSHAPTEEASELRARFFRLLNSVYHARHWTYEAIQERVGISPSAVSTGFRRCGLPARSCGVKTPGAPPPRRQHSVCHSALDDLGSPETAYTIGYLWADGRLLWRQDKGRAPEGIRLGISPRDEEILHSLQRFFDSNATIRTVWSQPVGGKSHRGLVVDIYSRPLGDRLAELGFGDRAQGTASITPPSVPAEVEADFWRGMWDGDGHIKRDKRYHFGLSGWELGLSGSKAVIDAFEDFANRTLEMPVQRVLNGHSAVNYRGYVTGVRAPILADVLYPADCSMALGRKYRRARAIADARAEGLQHGLGEVHSGSRLLYTGVKHAKPHVDRVLRDRLQSDMEI